MTMKTIYENLQKHPTNEIQLLAYEAHRLYAFWIAPLGEFDAETVYGDYPALTMHVFIIPENSVVHNLKKEYTVPDNSYAPGPINFVKGKSIVENSYRYGIGYSL